MSTPRPDRPLAHQPEDNSEHSAPLDFTVCDDLENQDAGAIEVILHMPDGTRRWCFFVTPAALNSCGDWLDGTRTRIHYGAPHMIVLAERLSQESIARALQHIARRGGIEQSSLLIE